jgi:hypothetical protein
MVVAFIRNFIFLQATVFYNLSNNVFSQNLVHLFTTSCYKIKVATLMNTLWIVLKCI